MGGTGRSEGEGEKSRGEAEESGEGEEWGGRRVGGRVGGAEKWGEGIMWGKGEMETAITLTCTNAGIIITIGNHLRSLFTHNMIVITM